jgi:hypothetical protein
MARIGRGEEPRRALIGEFLYFWFVLSQAAARSADEQRLRAGRARAVKRRARLVTFDAGIVLDIVRTAMPHHLLVL